MSDIDSNLKDLIDLKNPLMERYRKEAKGTFNHSQNVSNLCEAVALELNLNNDKLKVAGMYHDIGKINFPLAFTENQDGENLHDNKNPEDSYAIITRHVGDTVVILLTIENMPLDVIKWISEHHGNTVLHLSYDKSKSENPDEHRYNCNPPSSIESAVLMICDSIEATARSGQYDTAEKVVHETFNRLEMDGQLDDIKIGQIRKIKKIIIKEVDALYHSREAYIETKPEVKKKGK